MSRPSLGQMFKTTASKKSQLAADLWKISSATVAMPSLRSEHCGVNAFKGLYKNYWGEKFNLKKREKIELDQSRLTS